MNTYVLLLARGRLERQSEFVLRVLEKFLPGWLKVHPLLVLGLCKLGRYTVETALLVAALSGLLLLSSPLATLSLMFTVLLAAAASVGLTTANRTIVPVDEERLTTAPISDRQAYSLAFLSAGLVQIVDNIVILPTVAGMAASIVLGTDVLLPALWSAVLLVVLLGFALALVVNRVVGALRVRRVQRGARGTAILAYVFFSVVAFLAGVIMARMIVPWVSSVPVWNVPDAGESSLLNSIASWSISLPGHVLEALSPAGPILSHAASPTGALASGAMGGIGGMCLAALYTATFICVASMLWSHGGTWYRSEWHHEWQRWNRSDLFNLAESFYLAIVRTVCPKDTFSAVQVRNLCRRREWTMASASDLFGGSLKWIGVGFAFGAAPSLQGSVVAPAIFALMIGWWSASEVSRGPFLAFQESLALDAEGRSIGLYRAAGVSTLKLYRAKLRISRIMGGLPLAATLVLIAICASLPYQTWVLLGAAGLAGWVVLPHAELLPSLISPHFSWDHPDELGDFSEQVELASVTRRAPLIAIAIQLVLVALLIKGWVSQESFPWVAAGVMSLTAVSAEAALRFLSARAAKIADAMDLPV